MAPEQARGKVVDKRADIWAFGVVVYEMLTGQRAFKGDDISETLASVLKDTPSLDALPATTPPALRRLVGRCLQRDVKLRLRDIGEVRIALEAAPTDPSRPPATGQARQPLVPALAAVAAVSLDRLRDSRCGTGRRRSDTRGALHDSASTGRGDHLVSRHYARRPHRGLRHGARHQRCRGSTCAICMRSSRARCPARAARDSRSSRRTGNGSRSLRRVSCKRPK